MTELTRKAMSIVSWEQIQEMVNQGAAENFKPGDEVTQVMEDGSTGVFAVRAVNHYQDGEVVFVAKDCIGPDRPMNDRWTNAGGWKDSEMRKYMNEELVKLFPAEMLAVMAKKKTVQIINGESVECEDLLFLPSEYEVFGEEIFGKHNGVDKQYPHYADRRNRISYDCDGDSTWKWLASPSASSTTTFCYVNNGGSAYNYNASYSFGVAPGFVIRKS